MEEPTEVTVEQTTTFIDDKAVEETSYSEDYEDTYANAKSSIASMLGRPLNYENFSWSTASNQGTVLKDYPVVSLLAATDYQNKIKGFNLIRGTVCMKINLNATPFQAGMLVLHFLPTFEALNSVTRNINISTICQQPNVQFSCSDASAVLKMPYVAPLKYSDRTKGGNFRDWGDFYLTVLSPLAVGVSAPTTVELSVFVWFEDVELAAPFIGNAKFSSAKEEAASRSGGTISNTLRTVASVAKALTVVPVLRDYATPTAWAAQRLAGIATHFGYSKPQSEANPTIVSSQYNRNMANAEGVDTAWPLGLLHNNRIRTIKDCSIRDVDEMSLDFLKGVEFLAGTVTWNVSDAVGTSLNGGAVALNSLTKSGTYSSGVKTCSYALWHPWAYVAQLCDQWRGNIKLRLKFVKTQFHTGRVTIVFTPNMISNTINLTNSTFSLKTVVDLSMSDEIELELPYMLAVDYIGQSDQIGQLNIIVQGNLRAPETVVQSINMLMFYSMGSNAEMQIPIVAGKAPLLIGNMDIGNIPGPPPNVMEGELCTGEYITSIKQLISRYSLMSLETTYSAATTMSLYPFTFGAVTTSGGTGTGGGTGGDLLSYLGLMYAFWRGSVKIGYYANSTGTMLAYLSPIGTVSALISASTYYTPAAVRSKVTNAGSCTMPIPIVTNDVVKNFQTYHIPYYNIVRMSPTRFSVDNLTASRTEFDPSHLLSIINTPAAVPILLRAAGDDYQLSYFVGAPPLFSSLS